MKVLQHTSYPILPKGEILLITHLSKDKNPILVPNFAISVVQDSDTNFLSWLLLFYLQHTKSAQHVIKK